MRSIYAPQTTRGYVTDDTHFPRLVSLACHDLRTPLATVYGFARTISRAQGLDPTLAGYSEMIEVASQQPTRSEALGHQEFVLTYKTYEPLGPSCLPA